MIDEGDVAPEFELPAIEDGEFCNVALDDYLGEDIIILAFYPADFNPSCSGNTTDLDELDLFTMQKDVTIVGISADSVYSHRAFADEYDLHIPLLADVGGSVAAKYGVGVDEHDLGYLSNRAVVVIDPEGIVQYAWQTYYLEELPPVEEVREAVESIGGGSAAEARYRVGHAHYVEGRRAFTSAMGAFEELEWMMAQGDFTRAMEEFEEAADRFNTAVRFAEDEMPRTYFERAEEKADALAQAAEWLAEASNAYASGEGAEGKDLRKDAERPMEAARDIHDPIDPDEFPPDEDPAQKDEAEQVSILPNSDDGPAATLDIDVDTEDDESDGLDDEMMPAAGDVTSGASDLETGESGEQQVEPPSDSEESETAEASDDGDEDSEEINDEELEEIAAELEEQTKQAQAQREADDTSDAESGIVPDDAETIIDVDDVDDAETAIDADDVDDAETAIDADDVDDAETAIDEPPAEDDEDDAETEQAEDEQTDDIELDLADPTEGDEDEDDDDEDDDEPATEEFSGGNHGVPDSL